ncbi:hypothetical protein, partial [Paraburkholderia nemoris]|uniref:hypothetical protein n=1 Tax=Paraburkholderia nemoris TaxID=2793076 RepID=UPI001B8CBC35
MNKTEPNPGEHDCRAKNAIQTRAANVVQRNSREGGIVQASNRGPAGCPVSGPVGLRLPTIFGELEAELDIGESSKASPDHGVAGRRIIGSR